MAQAVLVGQVGLARGKCFFFCKKNLRLSGPRNSYCSHCRSMQSEGYLEDDGCVQTNFFQASAHHCAVFFLIGQFVFAVLFVIVLYTPQAYNNGTGRQAVFSFFIKKCFFVNVSWYPVHWHVTFTSAIPSTAVVFIPFQRGKEKEVNHCHLRDGRGEVGVQGQCLAFPCPSALQANADVATKKCQIHGILFYIN